MPKHYNYFRILDTALTHVARLSERTTIEYIALSEEPNGTWVVSWYEPGSVVNTVA